MAKKLTKRKHSVFVTEKVIEALSLPLRNRSLTKIEAIRKFGVNLGDMERGYSDDDLRQMKEALALADREMCSPGDFVSAPVFSAAQGSNREREDRSPDIDPDEVFRLAKNKGFFDLPKYSRKRTAIVDDIIKTLGLYKNNKSTSLDSRRRNINRILDSELKKLKVDI